MQTFIIRQGEIMARTTNGRLAGRAAVTQLREDREYVLDMQAKARHKFDVEWRWNLRKLKRLDPNGWEEFYDNAPGSTCKEMLPLIKERIKMIDRIYYNNPENPDPAKTRMQAILKDLQINNLPPRARVELQRELAEIVTTKLGVDDNDVSLILDLAKPSPGI